MKKTTKQVSAFIALVTAASGLFAGCSPGSNDNGAPSQGQQPVTCTPGTGPCFCPDGTQSGVQICDANGNLNSCVCQPQLGGGGGSSTGGAPGMSSDPTRLCPALAGMRSCSAKSYASEQVPSSMLFVIDRSGSMDCNVPPVQSVESCNQAAIRADKNQPSRWEITRTALDKAFNGLNGTAASVGLSLFSTDGACGVDATPVVPLAPASAVQLGALSEAMNDAVPAGGTPIVGGVITAYHHLHEVIHAGGNRFVVLITDGEEGCGTKGDEADKADLAAAQQLLLKTEVQKARQANIRTFVVGAPGSEGARAFLSELAFQGGTARTPNCVHGDGSANGDCHFDLSAQADFATVLADTLGKISGRALGCEFQAPEAGNGDLNVQTSKNGSQPVCLPQVSGACDATANGWQYAKGPTGADDTSRVVLCGQACDQVMADPSTVVDVILGCGSIR